MKIVDNSFCPYCSSPVKEVSNAEIYGRTYGIGLAHRCTDIYSLNCDAYVNLSADQKPGKLANGVLRRLRIQCHSLVDACWKDGTYKRREVYKLLAKKMNISRRKAHIAQFNEKQCRKLLKVWLKPI